MANVVASQILEDGPSLTVVKLIGQLDTSDEAYVVKLDPATLSTIDTQGARKATRLRIMRILANIEDGLTVNLWWDTDGTQANAKLIESQQGRMDQKYDDIGGLVNNATSPTGKIALSTQGWTGGLTLSYSLIITTKKYIPLVP